MSSTGTLTARQRTQPTDRDKVRRAAHLLDNAFRLPGTNRRFGIDGVLGLVPGIGDAVGFALSTAVIVQAIRLGARGATVVRMVINTVIDAAFGSIPVVGSIFDFAFKANMRNLALLERHTIEPEATRVASVAAVRNTVIVAVVAALVFTVALVGLVVWVASLVF